MHWLTCVILLLASIGGVHLQCFSPNVNIQDNSIIPGVSNITEFGVDLFKTLHPSGSVENFFFSPYSIWVALMMAYFGSAGNTQREMETVLGVTDKISGYGLWKALGQRYRKNPINSNQYTFDVANRVYLEESLGPNSCLSNTFPSDLQFLDFGDLESSVQKINTFVSNTTKDLIPKILKKQDLIDVIMVMVNAAYFKGIWASQFDPTNTFKGEFSIGPAETAYVDMMSHEENFNYGESHQLGARVLELPYAGGAMSMFILLPSEERPFGTRFEYMVSNLNGFTLRHAIDPINMAMRHVNVILPKFEFEMKVEGFKEGLQNIGIKDAFSEFRANFSDFGIPVHIYISKAVHKSFVKVNEEGTEAAAATALTFVTRFGGANMVFECDEPFLFLIVEKQTQNVLFMGAFKNPRELKAAP